MATPAEINKVLLYSLLLQHATSNELRDFCFRLNVVYESVVVPNDVVQTAIQKTINYFDARGRLPELIDQARREFANVYWQQVYGNAISEVHSQDVTITADSAIAIAIAGDAKVRGTLARTPGPLRIFLCHAREDKAAVQALHQKLKARGFDPWLDTERLRFGQKWRVEIPKAIQNSDVILVCLSPHSAKRDGYIKQEIGFALDIADKQPEEAIFIIPVRLEECDYPERLGDWHGADVFDADALERLLHDLVVLAEGFEIKPIVRPSASMPQPSQDKIVPLTVIAPTPRLTMSSANPLPNALTLTPEQRAQLRELLARVFDLEDLRTLVFDLGLNHEDISGDTMRARTRELIAFLEKRERLSELIAWARRERPTIDWVNLANPANAKNVEVSAAEAVRDKLVTPTAQVVPPKPVADSLIIDLPKLKFHLDLVRIPAGQFMMGSDQNDDEKPIHKVILPEYWIGKYPVTNSQYAIFAKAVQRKFELPKGKEAHPVVRVNWRDAQEFCKWLSEGSGRKVMLPSEAEFEKAARGTDTRVYPWGNQKPDKTLCNFGRNENDTTPVDKYSPKGDSPYGCADIAGNVWEWTRSKYQPYPYRADDGRESANGSDSRVVRGGSWANTIGGARCAARYGDLPDDFIYGSGGFRVVVVAAPVL